MLEAKLVTIPHENYGLHFPALFYFWILAYPNSYFQNLFTHVKNALINHAVNIQ